MSNNGRPIDESEKSLWGKFIEGIRPLKPSQKSNIETPPAPTKPSKIDTAPNAPYVPKHKPTVAQTPPPTENMLDRRTLDRLTKGKMAIEGTIDLHDKTQDQAYNALVGFVTRAFQSHKRCVLVITGKGTRTKADEFFYTSKQDGVGVLKSRLPEWVNQPPMNEMVLKHVAAHRNHGGGGAFYLYLKRQRPKL